MVTSFMVGCGGAKETAAPPAAPPPPSAPAEDGVAQATRGATLFAEHCAPCHGDAGEGSKKAPPLVGAEALPLDPRATAKVRKAQFKTALDVAQFAMKNMPGDAPGSLPEAAYWDIIAFDLKANGVNVAGKHIDANTAADIKLH
jgi:cytochrome c